MYHFHFPVHFILNTIPTIEYGIYAEIRNQNSMMNSLPVYTDLVFLYNPVVTF